MNRPQTSASGRATTVKKLFSRETSVAIDIAAPATTIWMLLTDITQMAAWNSTLLEITGTIAPAGKIALRSKLAPDRTFRLRVKTFEPPNRLSWGDAMGTRTYTLTPLDDGRTRFTMTEIIGGPIFPLFAKLIPSFDESFNQVAADLKKVAEAST